MKLNFSGRRALLLGGSSDLGLELAGLLIQEKIFPFLTCRNRIGEEKINDQLNACKGHYGVVYLDFGQMETIDSVFDEINNDLDFMVDFAHGDFEGLVGSADSRDVSAYFAENISARAEVIKRTGRAMLRKKKGRMIFISSAAAGKPNPGQGFYAASKLAAEALYRNLGLELKDRGITTLSLRPGYIDAGRGKRYLQARLPESANRTDQTHVLTAKETAETILFFLSDNAAGFTATTIPMGEPFQKIE